MAFITPHNSQNSALSIELKSGSPLRLRRCGENIVKRAVIQQFVPRFAPSAKTAYFAQPRPMMSWSDDHMLRTLDFSEQAKQSFPDIILWDEKRGWIFLIEAVHSFGPISPERMIALEKLCKGCNQPLVFVTAFLDRNAFRKFAPEVAWETEVWIAEEPDHMIHFNGDRFFGPRSVKAEH